MTVFGDGTFKGVIKIDEVIIVGPGPIGRVALQEKEETPELSICAQRNGHGRTQRGGDHHQAKGRRCHRNPSLSAP